MTEDQILAQSKSAYLQWAVQWREQAKYHFKYPQKPLSDFENIGIGKAILCVANGYSLEENIDVIRANQNKVDIICCDKTLGSLLDNGITPTYCMVCDANVNYEVYLKPWKDKVENVILLNNVCGNPQWADNGNWKNIYFFVNKDILKSEKEFSELSGCNNFIPASTNVSNAMVVLLTNSDNDGRRNFFGYDKLLLIGYDYSWRYNGKYYAFNKDGGGKGHYMRHLYITTVDGEFGYSSGNLMFSAQWLDKYIKTFNLPVVQCTKKTVFPGNKTTDDLGAQMNYLYKPEDGGRVRDAVTRLRLINKEKRELEKQVIASEKDHWNSFLKTV